QWDLRGWEHRHLWTLFNSHQHTLYGHSGAVHAVAFSPNGARIASGGGHKYGPSLDTDGMSLVMLFSEQLASSGAISEDSTRYKPGELRVWDARTGEVVHSLKGHTGRIMSVAYSPDGRRIATGGVDGTVRAWDAEKGLPLHVFKGHSVF